MHELPDMLGLIEVLELMHSQIAQRGWRRQCLAHEVGGESGEENLAAMCDAAQSSAVVHGRAVVVVQAQLGFTGVQRHSDAQERWERPRFECQAELNCTRACGGVGCAREHGKAAVALAARADHLAAMLCHKVFDERVVARQRFTHGLRIVQPGSGAALDVGEEKGDCPRRQLARYGRNRAG